MAWYQRLLNVFRAEKLNNELDAELQYHLAETLDRLIAEGMPPHEARHAARLRLGNYSIQKEGTRDMNIAGWLDSVRADLLYGCRQLRLNPGFAMIAVLSLALGIGANAAIFQLVNAIRLRSLPVERPQDLALIDFEDGAVRYGSWWGPSVAATYQQFEQIHNRQKAFTDVMAWSSEHFNLARGGEPHYAQGLYVSGGFFNALGVKAMLGRTLTDLDDTQSACAPGAVISYSFWQRELAGDANVLGRKLSLNSFPVPVIGITQPGFFGLEVGNSYDVAIPLCADRLLAEDRRGRLSLDTGYWLSMMGRLKPGWTNKEAAASLRVLSPGVMRATLPASYRPDAAKGYLANKLTDKPAGSGVSQLREKYERPLWMLMATTGLVLLISCANLANLLLARGAVREPEIAMRLAIGASRWRLVRQLLAESLLLAAAGAALGAGLALALSRALVLFISTADNPLFVDLSLDWRVLGFTTSLAVLTCLLFGLLPAVKAAYLRPALAMRAGVRTTAGRERFKFRRALVATQIGLSLILLFGALLFVRSLHNLIALDPGFRPGGLLTLDVDFNKTPLDYVARDSSDIELHHSKTQKLAVYRQIENRLLNIPGAVSVAQTSITPVSGNNWDNLIGLDNAPAATGKDCHFSQPGPGYFKTMDITMLAGRDFTERDTPDSPRVAIVNEKFARTFLNGGNPVGHVFHMAADAGKPEPLFQIVGLVKNTKYQALREDFLPIAYFPISQSERFWPSATFFVRIAGSPGQFMTKAKAAMADINPLMGIQFGTFSAQIENSLLRERLMATLSGGFGLLAGILATLGLYGVIAYMVTQRRNEIGVRVALGANRASVVGLVLREAMVMLVIGVGAGSVLSIWAGRAAASLLFGVQSYDLISLIGSIALLAAISLLASYLPARRAAAIDPMIALRSE